MKKEQWGVYIGTDKIRVRLKDKSYYLFCDKTFDSKEEAEEIAASAYDGAETYNQAVVLAEFRKLSRFTNEHKPEKISELKVDQEYGILEKTLSHLGEQDLEALSKKVAAYLKCERDICEACKRRSVPPDACQLINSEFASCAWSERCSWLNRLQPEVVKIQKKSVFSWTCPACKKVHEYSGQSPRLTGNVYCHSCETEFDAESTW